MRAGWLSPRLPAPWLALTHPRDVALPPQFLSGAMSEPNALLADQLDCLYRAFCFYHGSFERVKKVGRIE